MRFSKPKDIHSCLKHTNSQKHDWKWGWLKYLFPIAGLASLIWFLIRVIPKPSRAFYPCQRVAFPLASGFVIWLLGLGASVLAFRKAKLSFARRRYWLGLLCVILSVSALWIVLSVTDEKSALAEPQPANQPMGVAKGIYPGRVVWMHDPDATDWDGPGNGHPWQAEHTDVERVHAMMSRAVRELTGAANDAGAWDALFKYHNRNRDKGNVGYKVGEKIFIKVNFVGFIFTHGGVNPDNYNLETKRDYMNTSPQMLLALLRQLVNEAGVEQPDIAICDSLAYFANEYFDIIKKEFPGVRCLDRTGKFGRVKMKESSVPLYWSCNPTGCKQDYVPESFARAEYLINLANLKGHTGSGVTLCAKNHYGSLVRWPAQKGYYDMHKAAFSRDVGIYRNQVDLMGHSHIGGKTMLYLIDGLYCGIHPVDMDKAPRRWKSAPFNGDWTSSLLASQDPVAIDSVGFDFLFAEYEDPARRSGVDDYLHEAACTDNPKSGTFYDPDHPGNVKRLASLGVHEHWNNPQEKKYSRNLGAGEGIELVAVKASNIIAQGAKVEKLADGFEFTEGPAVDAEGNVFFTDQPNNRIHKWSVDGKLTTWHESPGRANGLYFNKNGDLLACADMDNELWLIDMNGKATVLVKDYKGKKLNGPNDLWEDPKGGVYFTDPLYKRSYWTRDPAMQQDGKHVYYLKPGYKELIRVTQDLNTPNGIIGTPDGKKLYVADLGAKKTYVYDINPDGTLSNKTLFCSMGSDGMTIDNEGNVYLTGRGVTVFNSAGEKIEHIPVDAGWTANVTFGGKDRHTLFITAQTSLYSLRMRVKGVK
ncbi:MAG: SMP-30/gluconolactonase/LRE family protein [Sedimentisphaerales bacterium]|nr:SMP-30/gluconolactonase/LRE family protein [Sedimentisphaerales bacterium]